MSVKGRCNTRGVDVRLQPLRGTSSGGDGYRCTNQHETAVGAGVKEGLQTIYFKS